MKRYIYITKDAVMRIDGEIKGDKSLYNDEAENYGGMPIRYIEDADSASEKNPQSGLTAVPTEEELFEAFVAGECKSGKKNNEWLGYNKNYKHIIKVDNKYYNLRRAWGPITVDQKATLTLDGEGTIDVFDAEHHSSNRCLNVLGGAKVIINGNITFKGNGVCVYCHEGTVEINGGEFFLDWENTAEMGNSNGAFMLNCLNANWSAEPRKADIIVKGGIYHGYDPSTGNKGQGHETNFVAEGYKSVQIGTEKCTDGVERPIYKVVKA